MNMKEKIQSLVNHCNRKTASITTDLTNAVKSLSTRLDRYTDGAIIKVEYMDIAPYRSGETFTAPEKEGYYFAGWFTDEVCATSIAETQLTGNAYAKFVPASVFDVRLSPDTAVPDADGNHMIRALASVVDLKLNKVGFAFKYSPNFDTEYSYICTKVFQRITGRDNDPWREFCSLSTYYMTLRFTDIKVKEGQAIRCRSYMKTLDGTEVYGKEKEVATLDAVHDKCDARISDIYYPTLAEAISAAAEGDTIVLQADCKYEGDFSIDKSVTLTTDGEQRNIILIPASESTEVTQATSLPSVMETNVESPNSECLGLSYVANGDGENINFEEVK